MNVSFSTRGWQQIPWEQQVQMAETMRFGGVELYTGAGGVVVGRVNYQHRVTELGGAHLHEVSQTSVGKQGLEQAFV